MYNYVKKNSISTTDIYVQLCKVILVFPRQIYIQLCKQNTSISTTDILYCTIM